jgi:hypothetical protein
MAYPFWLRAYHAASAPGSCVLLLGAFSMPLLAAIRWLYAAFTAPRSGLDRRGRQLALLAAAAPPLFVGFAFALKLAHWPLPELASWVVAWCIAGLWASSGQRQPRLAQAPAADETARVVHGVIAAAVLAFIAFHLVNHLFGLLGPQAHAAVMTVGRKLYRLPAVEAMLVVLLLLQLSLGAWLAWRWSRQSMDGYRAVQVVTGVYLGFFVLTHMNSALVSARLLQGMVTDWAWASGAPRGLLHDAWNIRLLPHYTLGVFCALAHLACGLRVVLLAHGGQPQTVNRAYRLGLLLALAVTSAIVAGLCGARLHF